MRKFRLNLVNGWMLKCLHHHLNIAFCEGATCGCNACYVHEMPMVANKT